MKSHIRLAFGAMSVVVGVGCGGATSNGDLSSPDSGGSSPEAATPGQEGGAVGMVPTSDAGASPFNPSGIGAMIGAGSDGGLPSGIGAMIGASDGGLSFGVTPQVADGCDTLCAKEATANCPNQGATSDCALGCRLLLNNPACSTATTTLFACEGTSTVSCDSTGKASLDDCGLQTLSSAACLLQSANDPTLMAPCTTYCSKVAAAACPNDDSSGCQQSCQIVGGFVPACDPIWKAYVTCADSDTGAVKCGTDGKAGASGCIVQYLTYVACLYGGVTTVTDAGH